MKKQSLTEKMEKLRKLFSEAPDFVVRELKTGGKAAALVYFEGATDKKLLVLGVLNPLIEFKETDSKDIISTLTKEVIKNTQVLPTKDENEYIQNILDGFSVLLIDGEKQALQIKTDGWITRLPGEPPTSAVIKGPREGFVEDLGINLTLIRKRLKTSDFVAKRMLIGKYTTTKVCLCYINSIADPKIVKKLEERIKQIDVDGIIDSFYIQAQLENHGHNLFKQFGSTEKPDIVAAKVLEGRVAILVDGSPIVLTVPFLLIEDFQNSNDYYTKSIHGTFLRWMRLFSTVIAVLLPGAALSVVLFHYKLLPLKFLITVMNTTQGIPFAPMLEILFIILLFEILYESSLRMPRYLGLALSVVGALVLGDTAVKAGLVSPPAIMIVALTGVMLYTMPDQEQQLALLRIVFTIIGGMLGLFGVLIGAVFIIAYLANLDSYGTPYLGPYAPYNANDTKDGLKVTPPTRQLTRPQSIPNINKRRQR